MDGVKGGVIPTPEPASEPDFSPCSTPDSDTNSFALESLEPVPILVPVHCGNGHRLFCSIFSPSCGFKLFKLTQF